MAGFELGMARALGQGGSLEAQRSGAQAMRPEGLRGPPGARASGGIADPTAVGSAREPGFASVLDRVAGELEASLGVTDKKSLDLVMGEDVAIHDVMAAVTEAEIAVQMTSAVAVKVIQAYQEIWRMEI